MQLQKEVIQYLNQNNQAVKKSAAPKIARVKKDKVAAKKWLQ